VWVEKIGEGRSCFSYGRASSYICLRTVTLCGSGTVKTVLSTHSDARVMQCQIADSLPNVSEPGEHGLLLG